MLNITAFLMGIAHPQRLNWLKQNIDNLEEQNFPFYRKIVAIDQFNGHFVPESLVTYLKDKGWEVLLDTHRSRMLSTDRVLNIVDSEFLFYNEDDVLSLLPKIEDLETVFNTEVNGRKCGIISMTLGGTNFKPEIMDGNHKFIGDLKHINDNIILSCDNYDFFRRMEEYRNEFFFEFPGMFIKTEIFKKSHERAKNIGGQIETALTSGYFNNGFDKIYYKSSVCKKNSLSILLDDPLKVNSHCRLLTNLDPYQGNSPFGGGHFY
jgi:hypothetical protein